MADEVSTMMLKVNLGCKRCYKQIKKTLSKYRERYQIQSETFDEKQNTVTISGPFNPKELAKKLCCKAEESIKYIEILDRPPPPTQDPDPDPAPDPQEPEPVPDPIAEPPQKSQEAEPNVEEPVPGPAYPPVQPMGVCCRECYEGYGGGPCHQGYEGYERERRGYDAYGRPSYVPPCNYFSEEEPTTCTIM